MSKPIAIPTDIEGMTKLLSLTDTCSVVVQKEVVRCDSVSLIYK